MKRYFVKYIPVGGIIKGGDIYEDLLPNPNKYVKCLSNTDGERLTKSGHRRVKLFLCTRDIQVGDKVRIDYDGHPELEGSFDKIKGDYSYFTNPDGKEVPFHVFKVMGEISSEAKWAVEGMEFDENDVKKQIGVECYYQNREPQYQHETRHIKASDIYIPDDNEDLLYETILIKGCCGHYH